MTKIRPAGAEEHRRSVDGRADRRHPADGYVREMEPTHQVVLRPLSSPLPLGFAGLALASLLVTGFDLGWVSAAESRQLGMLLLVTAVPLQLITCVVAALAGDGAVAAAMGILVALWASLGLSRVAATGAMTSPAVGLVVLAGGVMLLGLAAAQTMSGNVLPASLVALAGLRFLVTGVYELTAASAWRHAAGVIGIAVVALAVGLVCGRAGAGAG